MGCRIWEREAEDGAEDQRPRLCGRRRGRARARERRGSFALAPELGSKLHLLWREKGESRATAAKQYAAEALADEEGLSVTGMELAEKNGFLELRVLLRYENEMGEAVVTIGGE